MLLATASTTASNASYVVEIVLGLLTLVSLAAVVVVYARANYAKTQIEALRGDRDDLTERVERLEKDLTEAQAQLVIEKNKVLALEKVVTGKDELQRIYAIVTAIADKVGAVV